MINAKYRVRDVAKDLDVKTNYVTELIEKNFGGAKKSSMTAIRHRDQGERGRQLR